MRGNEFSPEADAQALSNAITACLDRSEIYGNDRLQVLLALRWILGEETGATSTALSQADGCAH